MWNRHWLMHMWAIFFKAYHSCKSGNRNFYLVSHSILMHISDQGKNIVVSPSSRMAVQQNWYNTTKARSVSYKVDYVTRWPVNFDVFVCRHIVSDTKNVLFLRVQSGLQSMCEQTCKHLMRCTLYISMYLLIFG